MFKILSDFIITHNSLSSSFCSSIRTACRRIERFDGVVAEVIPEPTRRRSPPVSLYGAVSCLAVSHCNTTARVRDTHSRLNHLRMQNISLLNFCNCFQKLLSCSNSLAVVWVKCHPRENWVLLINFINTSALKRNFASGNKQSLDFFSKPEEKSRIAADSWEGPQTVY